MGISKRKAKEYLNKAQLDGIFLDDTINYKYLHRYLYKHIDNDEYDLILYNRFIIIYSKLTLVGVTLLYLPNKYHKYEDLIKKNRERCVCYEENIDRCI